MAPHGGLVDVEKVEDIKCVCGLPNVSIVVPWSPLISHNNQCLVTVSFVADCKEMKLLLPCIEQGETCKKMTKMLDELISETFKCKFEIVRTFRLLCKYYVFCLCMYVACVVWILENQR